MKKTSYCNVGVPFNRGSNGYSEMRGSQSVDYKNQQLIEMGRA